MAAFSATLWWALSVWSGAATERTAKLDASRFELAPLEVFSPTTLLFNDGALLLGADLLEAQPGVYRATWRDGKWRAVLARWLPQQELQGLQRGTAGELVVVSSRRFSAKPKDWANQTVTLEPLQLRIVDHARFNIPNRCGDDTFECGMVAALPIDGSRWLAVTAKRPARLHLMEFGDGAWNPIKSALVRLGRRYPVVSEVKRIGDQLAFLLKDRWVLAAVDLEKAVLAVDKGRVDLEPLLDFSHLKKEIRIANARVQYRGLAEGFDFAPNGDLLILLNNRGYPFRKSPDQILDARAKLLVFKAGK